MNRKRCILIAILFSLVSTISAEEISDKALKKLNKTSSEIWPYNEFVYRTIEIRDLMDVELFSVEGKEMQLGYVAFKKSMGRYEKFQYAVFYSPDMEVLRVIMLKYSSNFGAEISSRKWLGQFIGNRGEKLLPGKDVSAISGATYSVRAITYDIPKLTRELKLELKK